MPLPRPTQLCHDFLRSFVHPGDTVIDATAGNGHDTLFLAELVGETGCVIAFDVQAAAIAATREKLEAVGFLSHISLVHASHATMGNHAREESVAAIVFNLGYLPGADHSVATTTEETICALEAAAKLLENGGLLAIVCYPGHEGGNEEAIAVENWLSAKTVQNWRISRYGMLGTLRPAPFFLAGEKP